MPKRPNLVRLAGAIRRLLRRLAGGGSLNAPAVPDLVYWNQRAKQFGRRSVLNMAHPESEFEAITRYQHSTLFPYLKSRLKPADRRALDFGCGPGRFTPTLAALVGECVGVDPIQALLDLAPPGPAVTYLPMTEGVIPLEDNSVDVVWCCLVLGGLQGDVLASSVREIQRVLRPGGLLFLVENTQKSADSPHWRFRSCSRYAAFFQQIRLEPVGSYQDAGEEISIMTGRKVLENTAPPPRP